LKELLFVPALSGGSVVAVPRPSKSVLKKKRKDYPQLMLKLSFTMRDFKFTWHENSGHGLLGCEAM
jgi:hypothetical protein